MPELNLKQLIIDYVDYLQDEAYWRQLLTEYATSELFDMVLELLADESDDVVSAACLFVRDLVLLAPDCGCRAEFVEQFHESPLIGQLQDLVQVPSLSKREAAVCTLGKTCSRKSAGFLREVFRKRKDSDPILLPKLAFEIRWLTRHSDVAWFATQCFGSTSPVTRWAGLEILDHCCDWPEDEEWNSKYDAVSSVCTDTDLRVRASAQFMRDEMDLVASLRQIPTRAEKRRLRKELERRRPLSFGTVVLGFLHKMRDEGKADYSSQALDEYVETAANIGLDRTS